MITKWFPKIRKKILKFGRHVEIHKINYKIQKNIRLCLLCRIRTALMEMIIHTSTIRVYGYQLKISTTILANTSFNIFVVIIYLHHHQGLYTMPCGSDTLDTENNVLIQSVSQLIKSGDSRCRLQNN